jgi:hypothetical protein
LKKLGGGGHVSPVPPPPFLRPCILMKYKTTPKMNILNFRLRFSHHQLIRNKKKCKSKRI